MFGNLGTIEVVIISLVLLVLFGSKKLKEFARGLGEVKKEYDTAFSGKVLKNDGSEVKVVKSKSKKSTKGSA